MIYASSWKSGFYTGLITGVAIYAIAKTPKGQIILDKLKVVTDIIKDQVVSLTRQAVEVLDGTVAVAETITTEQTNRPAAPSRKPLASGSSNERYDPVI